MSEKVMEKALSNAIRTVEIHKHVTVLTLRHSCTIHLLENGMIICMIQKLMGHADVKITEIYTCLMNKNLNQAKIPLDLP